VPAEEPTVPVEEVAVPITAPELGIAPEATVQQKEIPTVIPAGGGGEAFGGTTPAQLPYLILLFAGAVAAAWSGMRLMANRH
jgi:hypothetical protein